MDTKTNSLPSLEKISEVQNGGIAMLIIDPQVDFHPGGSLGIANANQDSENIAKFIHKHMNEINQINITLDSHQRFHIAHSIFWEDKAGKHPSPFSIISAMDIQNGKWSPTRKSLKDYALKYAQCLETEGRFQICIWPEHCIVGTRGHNIVDNVHEAALLWAKKKQERINYVFKGTNSFTEHYSALRAEVEIPSDACTSLNSSLIEVLLKADSVVVCGEALSHCVNFTTGDLCRYWPTEKLKYIHVLVDASSSVGGFEEKGMQFLQSMQKKGVTLCKSDEYVYTSYPKMKKECVSIGSLNKNSK